MPSVWYATKAGEPRKYAMAEEPLPETIGALVREGFRIVRVDFELGELLYPVVRGSIAAGSNG